MDKSSIKILPSLLAADFGNLSKDIKAVEDCDIGGLHCDIMDGHFVPSFSFGPFIVQAVRRLTEVPLFVHLMIERPEDYIEAFAKAGAASITVHVEACPEPGAVLSAIHKSGAKAGLSVRPKTPIETIFPFLKEADLVLVMTVNPGWGGQSFIEGMLDKIDELRTWLDESELAAELEVDGGINIKTTSSVVEAGARVLVAGAAVFSSGQTVAESIASIRRSVTRET